MLSLPFSRSLKQNIPANKFKVFFAIILGTLVEYYDYALYGFCASFLAAQFFPKEDPTLGLLKTFGVFLAGSLSKPLGSLIFGYIGDRFGRRIALKVSIIGIAFPTLLMGVLPTYAEIGWLAPLFLLFCRSLQGIFTAGESDGIRIFIFESFFKTRPCFANSFSNMACMLGIYLASLASSWVIASDNPLWLWRIPFIAGGLLGGVIYLLRHMLQETMEFTLYQQKNKGATPYRSWKKILKKNKFIILAAICLCGSCGGRYHFYLVFLGNYLSATLKIVEPAIAAFNTSQAILFYTLFSPVAGFFADYFGLIRTIKMASYVLLIFIFLNILMLAQGYIPTWLMCSTTIGMVFLNAPVFALLLEKISVAERYRCLSLGHSLGSMIFSGSTPLISLGLWYITQYAFAPFIYFILLTLLGLIGIFFLRKADLQA